MRSPVRLVLTGAAARRVLTGLGLACLVTACGEVTALIGPLPSLSGLSGGGAPAASAPGDFAVPEGAFRYRSLLMQAWQFHFAMAEDPAIGFGQVHQESRFNCEARSPKGSKGCAQFMDVTAAEVNQWIPAAVRAACPQKSGCPFDPRWALTAMVEYDYRLWTGVKDVRASYERWGFTLSAYNGGGAVTGGERSACAHSHGCDPGRYFGNVERFCGAYGRSEASCRENREYPHVILERWAPGYHRWLHSA